MKRRRATDMKQMMKVVIVVMGCVVLLAIGCGGGSDDEGTDANTPTPDTNTPTPDTSDPTPDTMVPTPDTTLPPPIDTGAPPQPAGTCQMVFDCVNQCNPNDPQACMAACLGNASPEVQAQFNNVLQCQQGCLGTEPNTIDIQCMAETCFGDMHACMGNPGQELDCNGVFTCINGCPQTDQGCPGGCLISAKDKVSFDAFFAIVNCMNEACPTDPNADPNDPATQQCAQAALAPNGACEAEMTNCVGALPAGKPGVFVWSGLIRWIFDVQHWMHFQF